MLSSRIIRALPTALRTCNKTATEDPPFLVQNKCWPFDHQSSLMMVYFSGTANILFTFLNNGCDLREERDLREDRDLVVFPD